MPIPADCLAGALMRGAVKNLHHHARIRKHKSIRHVLTGLSILTSILFMTTPAQAGLLYWDALQAKSGTGGGGTGTLSISGNVAFASGGKFQVQSNAGSADLLTVSGNVTSESGSVTVAYTGTGSGPWKIMTAAAITPTFIASDPNMILKKLFGNTELWLERNSGTVIVVR